MQKASAGAIFLTARAGFVIWPFGYLERKGPNASRFIGIAGHAVVGGFSSSFPQISKAGGRPEKAGKKRNFGFVLMFREQKKNGSD